jgi:O-antigen/teichoic acid export membrane protein
LRATRTKYAFGEASNALTLLLFAALARALGLRAGGDLLYGDLVAILAANAILATVLELGFHNLLTREVARAPHGAWPAARHALARQMLVCIPSLLVLYAYMRVSAIDPGSYPGGLLIGASFCFRSLKETLRGVCRGLHRFGTEAFFLWTERLGLLVVAVPVVLLGGGLTELGLVFLAVRAADFLAFLLVLRRATPRGAGGTVPAATLAAALPFAISNLAWSMYYQVDTALLAALGTRLDTGLYGALYRFVDLSQVLPRLVIVVAYPVMAVAWIQDRARFHTSVREYRRLLAVLGVPMLYVLIAWSESCLRLAFGETYVAGAEGMRWVIAGGYFAFQSILLTQALQAAGRERPVAAALVTTVAFNAGVNVALIPVMGYRGAALATLATEAVYLAILAVLARAGGVQRSIGLGTVELAGALVLALAVLRPELARTPLVALVCVAPWIVLGAAHLRRAAARSA